MSSVRHHGDAIVAFCAGIATASVLFWISRASRDDTEELNQEERIGELPSRNQTRRRHHSSPQKRKWPWENREKLRSASFESDSSTASARSPSPKALGGRTDPETSSHSEAGRISTVPSKEGNLCIGSIFGLDVGGTLAKLVYFESEDPTFSSPVEDEEVKAVLSRRQSTPSSKGWNPVLTHQEHYQHLHRPHTNSVPSKLNVLGDISPPDSPTLDSASHELLRTLSTSCHGLEVLEHSEANNQYRRKEALSRFYAVAKTLAADDPHLSFHGLGGEFHFIQFETRNMEDAMRLIRHYNLHMNIQEMGGTGGGAHKFADLWKNELGIDMKKQDELDSLVAGMQFILNTVVGECYTYRPSTLDTINVDEWAIKVQREESSNETKKYPYLVVIIGTGVSVLRVDGPRKYERVSGSTIGGGTFFGLIRLLTDADQFDDGV